MAEASKANAVTAGTIVFFHPDLGIGGAERLVVDAAVGLQDRGHRVVIYTSHCDPSHCFDECRDGTLDVRVRGNWLVPMALFSRLTILCAILRQWHLLLHIWWNGEFSALKPHGVIVDQLSAGIPFIRMFLLSRHRPLLFYCHFPDLLLAQGRSSLLKRLYRVPFDAIEEYTMQCADSVAVNSNFTKSIVANTWPRLSSFIDIQVVYPCVDTVPPKPSDTPLPFATATDDKIILSINRFERKKDIALAMKAYAKMPANQRASTRLVLAGGYDSRVSENVQYHQELQNLADSLKLSHATINNNTVSKGVETASVLFLLSISNGLKTALLQKADLLVYTPSNEHFGIVPLEAMLLRLPVLAANTGGPVETVVDGVTGWLRDPKDVKAWSDVMRTALILSKSERASMGKQGADRVIGLFGREQMAKSIDAILDKSTESLSKIDERFWEMIRFIGPAIVVAIIAGVAGGLYLASGMEQIPK